MQTYNSSSLENKILAGIILLIASLVLFGFLFIDFASSHVKKTKNTNTPAKIIEDSQGSIHTI